MRLCAYTAAFAAGGFLLLASSANAQAPEPPTPAPPAATTTTESKGTVPLPPLQVESAAKPKAAKKKAAKRSAAKQPSAPAPALASNLFNREETTCTTAGGCQYISPQIITSTVRYRW